jgi:hypothetical protein
MRRGGDTAAANLASRRIPFALAARLATLMSSTAAAQIPPDVIVVTPLSHATLDRRKFSHPVQTITSQDISREGVANATQTLSQRAYGVSLVNSQGNPYQPAILYHGFEISPIQGTPAGLAVYVDGARFIRPSATSPSGACCRTRPSTRSASRTAIPYSA